MVRQRPHITESTELRRIGALRKIGEKATFPEQHYDVSGVHEYFQRTDNQKLGEADTEKSSQQ